MRAVVIAALLCGATVRTVPGWTFDAPPARRTACVISFNSFDEIQAFRSSLPPDEFEFLDLAPQGPLPAETSEPTGEQPPPWIFDRCRPDIRCEVAIYSAEFAGRFFGKNGFSLSALYDERRSVPDRLRIAHAMMSRDDFLAFVPTLEVFLARHPPERFDGESRALLWNRRHECGRSDP
jgi:hypothetical protein